MAILFPHDKFLHGKILPSSPLPPDPLTHSTWKSPPENVCTLPNNPNIRKQWSKFASCSPSHGDCVGLSHPKDISIRFFDNAENKWLSRNFDPVTLGKKWAWEAVLVSSNFWSLKKGTRTLNFSLEWALLRLSKTTGSIPITPGKQKKTSKDTSVICLLAKNTQFHIFVDGSLKLRR